MFCPQVKPLDPRSFGHPQPVPRKVPAPLRDERSPLREEVFPVSDRQSEVNYEEFENLHVVRRLKQIVANWWRVQLNFTDARGFMRGVPQGKFFNPTHPICAFITEQPEGFKDFAQIARTTTFECQDAKGPNLSVSQTGISVLALPLRVDGTFLGCVFADGFFMESTQNEQRELLSAYLTGRFGARAEPLLADLATLPLLSQKDITYLTELVEVVLEEIVSLRKSLSESGERLEVMSKELMAKWDFGKMVGKSPAMMMLFSLLTRVCESDSTILITGENGTGKEGIARSIHYNSKRKQNSFVIQNCGALNDNLLESELFGHVKGAFTNAIKDKKGLFELADRGTLFLDEIGDTSPSMQVKLLRVLQEGTFIPVGGSSQIKVDVRILAATNKHLEQMVREGTFREDLYYRLNVIGIRVPPLRDRRDDIPLLVSRFLDDYAQNTATPKKRLTRECMTKLERHDWPGNVRELQNEVERLCVLSGGDLEIGADLLSDRFTAPQEERFPGLRVDGKLKDAIEELERRMIKDALIRENWNKSKVARILGISRAGLIMKCEKFGFDREASFPRAAGD